MPFRLVAALLPAGLAFCFAIILTIESFLGLSQKSLCPTRACQAVGKYLSISDVLLVAGGAIFFWLLSCAFILAKRQPEKFQNIPIFMLVGAISADSALIGFQFFTIKQYCLLCLAVALGLLTTSALYCWARRSPVFLISFICIFIAGFSVQGIITMPHPQGAYINLAFLSIERQKEETTEYPKCTLIVSMNCPHCLEVIDFLSKQPQLKASSFKLATIDRDTQSLMKISEFLDKAPANKNIFDLFAQIKQGSDIKDYPIRKGLKTQADSALAFLSNLGINKIPALVVEQSEHERTTIIGSTEIIDFLITKAIVPDKTD